MPEDKVIISTCYSLGQSGKQSRGLTHANEGHLIYYLVRNAARFNKERFKKQFAALNQPGISVWLHDPINPSQAIMAVEQAIMV